MDFFGFSLLAGSRFTVFLLIWQIAVVRRLRNRTYRRLHEAETTDQNSESSSDSYQ